MEHKADLQERILEAMKYGDSSVTQRIYNELQFCREQLDELTAALLCDESLVPRWVGHTEADATSGAVPCLECGNNIPAGESICSYCRWTYLVELPSDAS
jgi:hypothetical protein